ncbi:MAG: leucine--tRNA ligase [Chitinophagaceae bacterium]|nr:leucine--tRNA ligase [Chitinophagaceae bacterium]
MEYNFRDIEKKWQQQWRDTGIYRVPNESNKPKYYVLDMFPYPSGAGLHVGHPLGYIASDIYSRYKRLKGFNVLHPMGYDAFGLPAEQYAIDHGIHPAVSTAANITNFRSQLDKIGFCFDWDREVNTSQPGYYKWTQWIFLQLFDSFYNRKTGKAERIQALISDFEKEGNSNHVCPGDASIRFSATEWKAFDEKQQMDVLMQYRLAYCGVGEVNWCEALGTVLANDEVVNGVSERGGYPVVKKKLRQWYLRITEYADRLLEGLDRIEFSEAMKEMQTNWIGKSSGAEIDFRIQRPPLTPPKGEDTPPKYQTAQPSLYNITKRLAEEKRKNPTHEEMILWEKLRNHQAGFHIRRQHIIGSYIVDFVCLQKMMTIEVDGGYHNDPEVQLYDKARTEFLKEQGFTELRFTNDEVRNHVETVVKKIKEELSKKESISKRLDSPEVSPLGGDLEGAPILRVYTTRPDTIFGVDFMVIAPEHDLVDKIKTAEQATAVDEYITYVKSRSERERMAEKKITGVFTGAYAINPFDGREIPIWISEYVLAGYGTGAIMAVPCGDERDHKFAQHFGIPITNIIGKHYNGEEANPTKDAVLENSDFINGIVMRDAIDVVINRIEEMGIGVRKVNYKMRDAAFSRQRYWGEPFPIKWINGIAYPLDESELPLELPQVDSYKPGPEGEGPLANIPAWIHKKVKLAKESESEVSSLGGDLEGALETNTMPGYAGSSWYFLRYMDPQNEKEFCSRKASDYWGQVDLYIGGTEHAVGHLLYSRMWTKVLCDLGYIGHDEPYKKLVNQGMIQGVSQYIYRYQFNDDPLPMKRITNPIAVMEGHWPTLSEPHTWFYSADSKIIDVYANAFSKVIIPIEFVNHKGEVDLARLIKYKFSDDKVVFVNDSSVYLDGNWSSVSGIEGNFVFKSTPEVEKMSKSKFNTVNPDDLVSKYGADTFRMYEMFLGPVEMSKPWDTKGIEGVHRFLKKLWRLFFDEVKGKVWNEEKATDAELKVLHKTIKQIEEATERFSFNTGVSGFMIAVNELTDLKCHKKEILEPLLILLAPYAPHIAEELYAQLRQVPSLGGDLGEAGGASILNARYPRFEAKYVAESSKEYPISINGKLRTTMNIALDASQPEVEKLVLDNDVVKKWLEGKPPKKIIFVKGKMVNVVI